MLGAPRGASGAGAPRVRGRPILTTGCRRMRAARGAQSARVTRVRLGKSHLCAARATRRGTNRCGSDGGIIISALLISRRPSARVRDGGARQGGCVGSRYSARDGVARPHQRIYTFWAASTCDVLGMGCDWTIFCLLLFLIKTNNTHANSSTHIAHTRRRPTLCRGRRRYPL